MTDFEKVIEEQRGIVPELRDILRLAVVAKRDAVSVVRKHPGNMGVCVVLIGDEAIRRVGPFLVKHVTMLSKKPGYNPAECRVQRDAKIPTIMAWVDEQPARWGYFDTHIDKEMVCVFFVTGESVDDTFAEELSKRGCLTRLR